jgi:hypothetical protein
MSATDAGTLVLALLGAAVVASGWGWTRAGRQIWPPIGLTLLVAAMAVAAPARVADDSGFAVGVALAVLLAVAGGGPVTAWVFAFIDRHDAPGQPTMRDAGTVLRGGAWIGALERAAIAASLLAGWPSGVALALALKGLGRYPELRSQENPGTAERFIIGTFTSVLWASACAGVVLLLR